MNLLIGFIIIFAIITFVLFVVIVYSNKKNQEKSTPKYLSNSSKKNVAKNNTKSKNGKDESLESLFYRAGIFDEKDKAAFNRKKVLYPLIFGIIGAILGIHYGGYSLFLMPTLGAYLGLKFPGRILNKRIKERDEDILYYLPLVIEQLVVGVSSALDIGPCIAYVVDMAEKRGTHNPVTILLKQVQILVRFGASLDDALVDVGKQSGHNELKNSFLQLSQVTKHGGEITKQLQDLGTTVTRQREIIIDERIKRLELKATGPVFLVFAGHMAILLAFLFMGLAKSLSN